MGGGEEERGGGEVMYGPNILRERERERERERGRQISGQLQFCSPGG